MTLQDTNHYPGGIVLRTQICHTGRDAFFPFLIIVLCQEKKQAQQDYNKL